MFTTAKACASDDSFDPGCSISFGKVYLLMHYILLFIFSTIANKIMNDTHQRVVFGRQNVEKIAATTSYVAAQRKQLVRCGNPEQDGTQEGRATKATVSSSMFLANTPKNQFAE